MTRPRPCAEHSLAYWLVLEELLLFFFLLGVVVPLELVSVPGLSPLVPEVEPPMLPLLPDVPLVPEPMPDPEVSLLVPVVPVLEPLP